MLIAFEWTKDKLLVHRSHRNPYPLTWLKPRVIHLALFLTINPFII